MEDSPAPKKKETKREKNEGRSRSLDTSERKTKKLKQSKTDFDDVPNLEERPSSSRGTQTDRSSIMKRISREKIEQDSGKSSDKILVEGALLTDSVIQHLGRNSANDVLTSEKTESSDVVSSDADQSRVTKEKNKKSQEDSETPETESFDEISDEGEKSETTDSSRAAQTYRRSLLRERSDLLKKRPEYSIATQTYRRQSSMSKKKSKTDDLLNGRGEYTIATQTYHRPSTKSKSELADERADSSRPTQTYRRSPIEKKKKDIINVLANEKPGEPEDESGVDEPTAAELGSKTDPLIYNKGCTPNGPDELVPYRPDPIRSSDLKRSSSAHVPFIELVADKKRKKQRPQETPTTDDQTPSSMSQRRDLKPSDSNEALIPDEYDVPRPYDDQGATSLEDTTRRTTVDKSGAQLGTSADESEEEGVSDIEGSEPQESSPEETAAKGSNQQAPDFLADYHNLDVDGQPTSEDEKETPSDGKETEDKEDVEKGDDGPKTFQYSSPSRRSGSGRRGKRVRKKLNENQRFMDKVVLVCSILTLIIMLVYFIIFAFLRAKDDLLLYFAIVNMPRNALTLDALFVMVNVTGIFPAILAIIGTIKKNELLMRMYLTLALIFAVGK